jgi:hypothetical protein
MRGVAAHQFRRSSASRPSRSTYWISWRRSTSTNVRHRGTSLTFRVCSDGFIPEQRGRRVRLNKQQQREGLRRAERTELEGFEPDHRDFFGSKEQRGDCCRTEKERGGNRGRGCAESQAARPAKPPGEAGRRGKRQTARRGGAGFRDAGAEITGHTQANHNKKKWAPSGVGRRPDVQLNARFGVMRES